MRIAAFAVPALLLVAAFPTPARAAWPNSPFVNRAMCTASNTQSNPRVVSDGAGGAIATWLDYRNGSSDIYAQHVLASGALDPAWPAAGVALCSAPGDQHYPTIVSDGAGGAIVTWHDYRTGVTDIYAQRVLASGNPDPAWPAGGRALCLAANSQGYPQIASDGAGGAIVTWYDYRSGTADIYAQRVLASGDLDPAWPADGRALCAATGNQLDPMIVSDGAGGAIVTWYDQRGGTADIYAQRVLASGAVDPTWPADGRALCTAPGDQLAPMIATDGGSGAFVTWHDERGGAGRDIYAHHVLASGALDPAWPLDGLALCTAVSDQNSPKPAPDGAGGVIVAWSDNRGGNYDIYAQHVLAPGLVDGAWPADGQALCAAAGDQYEPAIVTTGTASSGSGSGAVVTWFDSRDGEYDIYAQHVQAWGAVDGAWPADGRALCRATGGQYSPVIVTDGAGGAIVTWLDNRSGTFDIYAQRVARHGYLGTPEAEIVGVKDVPNDQGGRVKLSWNASWLDLAQDPNLAAYDVYRSVPPNLAAAARARGAVRVLREGDSGARTSGELVVIPASATAYAWEFVQSVNPNHFASQYSVLAPTAFDSLADSNPATVFLVLARNASGSMFWPSRPDSGYSVDNLAPAAPALFTGLYAGGSVLLHWNPNTESDLAGYRLYRGASAGFVPGPGNLVAALAGTGYADAPGVPSWYKLTAVDVHGNESLVATLLPAGTLGVEGGAGPLELSFAAPSPNPAESRTTLRFALPRAVAVRLAVYDAAGRLVRELASGAREAGEHAEAWDLRDAAGRTVRAGLYFARFEAAGRTLVRRVAVSR